MQRNPPNRPLRFINPFSYVTIVHNRLKRREIKTKIPALITLNTISSVILRFKLLPYLKTNNIAYSIQIKEKMHNPKKYNIFTNEYAFFCF